MFLSTRLSQYWRAAVAQRVAVVFCLEGRSLDTTDKHSYARFLLQCAANSGSTPPIHSSMLHSVGNFIVNLAHAAEI